MHAKVHSLVSSSKAKDTVSMLLDMHILEDEQVQHFSLLFLTLLYLTIPDLILPYLTLSHLFS